MGIFEQGMHDQWDGKKEVALFIVSRVLGMNEIG